MRVGMGLIKNEHGVWQVRKKVPKRLETVTATVLGNGKPRVSWLKETLRTKDKKRAAVIAKPVMMRFDRILADAEALLAERPLRTELSETEIKQLADFFYAHHKKEEERERQEVSAEEAARGGAKAGFASGRNPPLAMSRRTTLSPIRPTRRSQKTLRVDVDFELDRAAA